MAINIKELFSGDSENIRLDKINYNFDQIVANGGGPIGLTGSKGDVGPQGPKGDKGDTGTQGSKGEPGIATDYFVRTENAGLGHYMLSPVSDLANHDTPATILFGDFVDGTSSLTDEGASPVIIKMDQTYFSSALRFTTDDAAKYIDIKLTDDGSTRLFQFVPNAVGSSDSVYKFVGKTIKLTDGGDKIVLNSTSSSIASALTISGNLKITSGSPSSNKYLKSDASGNATWSTLGTAVPIGTIVMVSKFVLDNSVDWNGIAPAASTSDYIGRGTGDWAGWYYCWGKTWGTYETPDMRERYPIGYIKNLSGSTGINYTGNSVDVESAAVGNGETSDNSVAGYFGTNDIDNLQASDIKYSHNHATSSGYAYAQASASSSGTLNTPVLVGATGTVAGQYSGTTSTSIGDSDGIIDISPRSAVVGFMIYLGSGSLSYTVFSSGSKGSQNGS